MQYTLNPWPIMAHSAIYIRSALIATKVGCCNRDPGLSHQENCGLDENKAGFMGSEREATLCSVFIRRSRQAFFVDVHLLWEGWTVYSEIKNYARHCSRLRASRGRIRLDLVCADSECDMPYLPIPWGHMDMVANPRGTQDELNSWSVLIACSWTRTLQKGGWLLLWGHGLRLLDNVVTCKFRHPGGIRDSLLLFDP